MKDGLWLCSKCRYFVRYCINVVFIVVFFMFLYFKMFVSELEVNNVVIC